MKYKSDVPTYLMTRPTQALSQLKVCNKSEFFFLFLMTGQSSVQDTISLNLYKFPLDRSTDINVLIKNILVKLYRLIRIVHG